RSFSCQRSAGRVPGAGMGRGAALTLCTLSRSPMAASLKEVMMKSTPSAGLGLQTEMDAIINDHGLLTSPRPNVDREKLQHHLGEALRLLHVDLDDENLRDTPRRWSESLVTLTSGYDFTDVKKLTTLFRKACSAADENCKNLVVIGGTYKTLCAHHILPFFGQFIVGYIPEKMIIGASKIPRIVEVHMRRLQSQEHLAHDVTDTIDKILEPRGIAVWMGGVHMCMVMRGVEQESSFMETNVLRGEVRDATRPRAECRWMV